MDALNTYNNQHEEIQRCVIRMKSLLEPFNPENIVELEIACKCLTNAVVRQENLKKCHEKYFTKTRDAL